VATLGRRVVALLVDWFGCVFVISLLSAGRYGFGADPADAQRTQLFTLLLFIAEVTVLTWLGGASAGQRILGIGVRRIDGQRLDPLRALMRTVLICLIIPAVVYDRDGRGLHDRAASTIVVRSR
jgi:uncharacterized RDD family membrane protein YckC